ncbi:MAG: LptF/LptG family permease [Aquificaceae bacterium]|nr:LptF/LptG family permease [Aquificaceae bacterium]MCX8164732.1 LptF/LptG family permease [Aquificaceae bacterium]
MIFRWFFWKSLKLSLFISSTLTILLLLFQIFRFDQIMFQLPLEDSLPFLFLWFFYYFSFMLPMAIFLSFSINLFELKENKKLQVVQAFGIDPKSFYVKSLFLTLPVFVSLFLTFFTLREEDIGHMRRQLTLRYYALIITSVPIRSFHTFGQFTLYVEKREGNSLGGVFFKFQEGVVIAKGAEVKGEEILFEKGSLLTQKEGKTFSTDFDTYRLSLNMVMPKEREFPTRGYVVGVVNLLLSVFFMGLSCALVRVVEHHHKFYYVMGALALFYQAILFLVRQMA